MKKDTRRFLTTILAIPGMLYGAWFVHAVVTPVVYEAPRKAVTTVVPVSVPTAPSAQAPAKVPVAKPVSVPVVTTVTTVATPAVAPYVPAQTVTVATPQYRVRQTAAS